MPRKAIARVSLSTPQFFKYISHSSGCRLTYSTAMLVQVIDMVLITSNDGDVAGDCSQCGGEGDVEKTCHQTMTMTKIIFG